MHTIFTLDLKRSSIFDLTHDSAVLENIIGDLPDKLEYEKHTLPELKVVHMLSFAEETGNVELVKRIETEFKESLSLLFNE